MSENNGIYQLIIKNLKMIEQTNSILDEIQETIFNRIDNYILDWANQNHWLCEGKFWSTKSQIFYPENWDKALSYFSFALDDDIKNKNISWLSYLNGTEHTKFGLFWYFSYGNKYKRQEWQRELKKYYDNNRSLFEKNNAKIVYGGRNLFIPITQNINELVANYPNDMDTVLEDPINEALNCLNNIFPVIDQIYKELIN